MYEGATGLSLPKGREYACVHIFRKYAVGMFYWKYVARAWKGTRFADCLSIDEVGLSHLWQPCFMPPQYVFGSGRGLPSAFFNRNATLREIKNKKPEYIKFSAPVADISYGVVCPIGGAI